MYGPVQLAVVGAWDTSRDVTVMPPGLDPSAPQKWLVPVPTSSQGGAADALSLHWSVQGHPDIEFLPYYEIQEYGTLFDTFPCFAVAE